VFGAETGDPVPERHAFDADHYIFKEWKNDIKQCFRIGLEVLMHPGITLLIEDAHIHFSCMRVDAAIKFVLLI